MAETTFVPNPTAIAALLRGPTGPVVRNLIVKATRVQTLAKVYVGKRTHNLERTIVKRIRTNGSQVIVEVGSTLYYAYWHHEGTPPHKIEPKRASVLVFVARDGNTVFARSVNHPGTKPNRFLVRALTEVMGE